MNIDIDYSIAGMVSNWELIMKLLKVSYEQYSFPNEDMKFFESVGRPMPNIAVRLFCCQNPVRGPASEISKLIICRHDFTSKPFLCNARFKIPS